MEAVLPVFIRNDAALYFLMVLANANGKPGAQLSIVERVYYTEHLSLVEAQPIRRFFLVFKMCPNVKGVAHV